VARRTDRRSRRLAVVDEGTALPMMTSYPLVSHARGVVGHATLGLTIGVLLALLDQPA
jgi:hypothetical protein